MVGETTEPLKLNIGSGQNPKAGYVNIDRAAECRPDVVLDVARDALPFADGSVAEVSMNHAFEHIGETVDEFFHFVRELYRVCWDGALIRIAVPAPSHDNFLNDPTHVRAITPDLLALFSRRRNRQWAADGMANSPLALYLGVDFELVEVAVRLDQKTIADLGLDSQDSQAVMRAMRLYRNVIEEYRLVWRVVKP